jgi:alpha-tubulin suppressor-like RCC1 family protein
MRANLRVPAAVAARGLFVIVLSLPGLAAAQVQPAGAPCLARATAVIADTGSVVLNAGSVVDSYQSSLGPYGGANVGSAATVRAASSITVNSGAVVRGMLMPNSPAGLQTMQPPASAIPLGNVLVNSWQTRTLTAGSYVATGLTLNSNASLVASGGPVLLWVTGMVVISGAVNATGPAANFQLLVTSTSDINVNTGAVVHGVVYAPAAHVNLNAPIYGSVVGDLISIFNTGGAVHYDQNEACPLTTPAGPQISAGAFASCDIRPSGNVECWGNDNVGQLGDGNQNTFSTVPVAVQGLTGAVAISQGNDHTCALTSSGTVACWGDNSFGELGVGSTTGPQQCVAGLFTIPCSTVPVAVPGLGGVVGISAGSHHTCAVLATGGVECWGDNTLGELGDGTTTARSSPVAVTGISHAISVSAGLQHSCALLQAGAVQCWGDNSLGAIGDGTTTTRLTPVTVTGIANATSVSAGFNFTCATLATGMAECWGVNAAGQLGVGTTLGPNTCSSTACSPTPVAVQGLTSAVAIGANGDSNAGHACALLSNSSVQCWGDNTVGELGDDTTTSRTRPVPVLGLGSASVIAVGGQHTCSSSGGLVACWGSTAEGQVGTGTSTGPDLCPNASNPCAELPLPVTF